MGCLRVNEKTLLIRIGRKAFVVGLIGIKFSWLFAFFSPNKVKEALNKRFMML